MMAFGSARQVKGLASVSLGTAMKQLLAACRSTTERKTPCLNRHFVSLAKRPSTAYSQEPDVAVKWNVYRGWRASHLRTPGILWEETLFQTTNALAGGLKDAPRDRQPACLSAGSSARSLPRRLPHDLRHPLEWSLLGQIPLLLPVSVTRGRCILILGQVCFLTACRGPWRQRHNPQQQ